MAPTLFPGVAMVTGAAGTGIGASVAKAFAAAGCERIAITDLNEKLLADTLSHISEAYPQVQIYSAAGDISDEKFVDSFVKETVRKFGRLDYCVNCAGILGNNAASHETTTEEFDRINGVNYRGCWFSSRAQIRAMLAQEPLDHLNAEEDGRGRQRGAIVNIASQLGIVGRPCAPAYSASKAAVMAMTRADAIDYSSKGIRVNCICPGIIETPMTTADKDWASLIKPAVDIAPMKRMGKPSEIADCALFLASAKASFVQGHAMVVDGGYIIE